MQVEQKLWTVKNGWQRKRGRLTAPADLVLLFGAGDALNRPDTYARLAKDHPDAHIFGCSTAGEICGTRVTDDCMVSTAVHFEHSKLKAAQVRLADVADSRAAGARLAGALDHDGLRHVLVFSDGLKINGSELVDGLRGGLPADVAVTGGLSGDGARFKQTFVVLDGPAEGSMVAAIGLYGARLRIGYGSLGGWDPFGPERKVTRAKGNVLYELDGQSALGLYKTYLGEYASGLPATGLLFPLALHPAEGGPPLVRTILAVDEAEQSLTFAGDLPVGSRARFMKANFERLIDGATGAAKSTTERIGDATPELAILISCVGRKLVLKQRIEDEVEGVRDVLGDSTALTGFYSYGEICPFGSTPRCELHNQTMTITTLTES